MPSSSSSRTCCCRSLGCKKGGVVKKNRQTSRHKAARAPRLTARAVTSQRSEVPGVQVDVVEERIAHPVPYDENLLERARTQWQFGDWDSLAQLDRDALQHHPDRAKLALLAAAGRLQTNRVAEARQFIQLAQDWGVSKKLVAQILMSGVHNSLGRAAALAKKQTLALQHFKSAITIGTPGAELRLTAHARADLQTRQLNKATTLNSSKINRAVESACPKVKIMGAFRSGTNYLKTILEWNTRIQVIFSSEGGWKHNVLNDEVSRAIKILNIPVIFVVKNPFALVKSIYIYKKNANKNIICGDDWNSYLEERFIIFRGENREETAELRFSSPFEYWNVANWSYLSFSKKNTGIAIIIKYEDIIENPVNAINKIIESLKIDCCPVERILSPENSVLRMGDMPIDHQSQYMSKIPFDREFYRQSRFMESFTEEQIEKGKKILDKDLIGELDYRI